MMQITAAEAMELYGSKNSPTIFDNEHFARNRKLFSCIYIYVSSSGPKIFVYKQRSSGWRFARSLPISVFVAVAFAVVLSFQSRYFYERNVIVLLAVTVVATHVIGIIGKRFAKQKKEVKKKGKEKQYINHR